MGRCRLTTNVHLGSNVWARQHRETPGCAAVCLHADQLLAVAGRWAGSGRAGQYLPGRAMIPGQSVGLLISLLLAEQTKQDGSLLLQNYTKLEQMSER